MMSACLAEHAQIFDVNIEKEPKLQLFQVIFKHLTCGNGNNWFTDSMLDRLKNNSLSIWYAVRKNVISFGIIGIISQWKGCICQKFENWEVYPK